MRRIGTFPCHQRGFAESSAPLVGLNLSIFHGPVPMTSVPGFPNVVLCACWNFFSKINAKFEAAVNFQFGSGYLSVTTTLYRPTAFTFLTLTNANDTCESG